MLLLLLVLTLVGCVSAKPDAHIAQQTGEQRDPQGCTRTTAPFKTIYGGIVTEEVCTTWIYNLYDKPTAKQAPTQSSHP
jgi:hypothetical protein